MGLFDSFFGSSSRSRSHREWYGSSSRHGGSSSRDYYGSSSRQGHSSQDDYNRGRPHHHPGVSEPYYNFTRDDRTYSFGRRQGHNEQVRFRRPEVPHREEFYNNRVPEPARANYSRDPYRSHHPKPCQPSSSHLAQREHIQNYHYGVNGYGGGRNYGGGQTATYGGGFGGFGGGGFGGGYGHGTAASYLEMDGRYPRFR